MAAIFGSGDVTIRTADERDLPAIGSLHHRSRTLAYAGFLPAGALAALTASGLTDYWFERWRRGRATNHLSVAIDEGEIVGFSYVGPDADPGIGVLFAIHVDPAAQGQGIGTALIADALERLVAGGCRRAVLWVIAENVHARRFYEHGGWTADGAERNGYVGPAQVRQLRYTYPLPHPRDQGVPEVVLAT